MKVLLIAQTDVNFDNLASIGYVNNWENPNNPPPEEDDTFIPSDEVDSQGNPLHYTWNSDSEYTRWLRSVHEADELAEAAGRLCYKSFDRPNPETGTNDKYLANILKQRHFSVLEHASASFYIAGVSRSLTHELVRHRHLSFSQVSQRYVDESNASFEIQEWMKDLEDLTSAELNIHMAQSKALYRAIDEELTDQGYAKKAARGAARSVLPNMTNTALIVTGNHRTWREVIEKRNSPAADAEIRELAEELLKQLREIAPNTYQDFE